MAKVLLRDILSKSQAQGCLNLLEAQKFKKLYAFFLAQI
jgi:hypothetical protein